MSFIDNTVSVIGGFLLGSLRGYGASGAMRNLVVALSFAVSSAEAQEVRVAALGDSLTQGYGLSPEKGFVPQLEAWLRGQGAEVAILNAGVSGDTTAGGVSRIDWTLTDEVDALIVALGGNDVLRGIDPVVSRANLDAILLRATEKDLPVLLAGISAPGNYGPDYKTEFEAIYPELAQVYGTLLYPDFLNAITSDPDRIAVVAELMQADGIHPNADGVAQIVADIGPLVLELIARAR